MGLRSIFQEKEKARDTTNKCKGTEGGPYVVETISRFMRGGRAAKKRIAPTGREFHGRGDFASISKHRGRSGVRPEITRVCNKKEGAKKMGGGDNIGNLMLPL